MTNQDTREVLRSNVLDRVSDGILSLNSDLEVTFVNPQAEQLLETTEESVYGTSIQDAFPKIADSITGQKLREALETGQRKSVEPYSETLDRWFEARIYPDKGGLSVFFTDISERKERELELKRTSQFLKETQEVANIGGWEVDLQSETLRWSDEMHRIHGVALDADVTSEDAIEFYHPEDRDTIREAFNRLTTEGEQYDLELRIIRADNDNVRWVRTRGKSVYEDGELITVRGTFQDVTECKKRRQTLQKQHDRLDEFASVVSHDLRNPLNVASGRTTLLQQQDDDELQKHLAPLATALERIENILEDTLTLAREGEVVGEMSSFPVSDFCNTCWEGVETDEATLKIDDEFTVRGDRGRLRHVFENLFRNAVEHGNDDVTVRVGLADEDCIYVEDNGPGIPPGERDKVFEPGHTSSTEGTGFGLTIVKRIVGAHGWQVRVTDGPDGGARFEFDTSGLLNE